MKKTPWWSEEQEKLRDKKTKYLLTRKSRDYEVYKEAAEALKMKEKQKCWVNFGEKLRILIHPTKNFAMAW